MQATNWLSRIDKKEPVHYLEVLPPTAKTDKTANKGENIEKSPTEKTETGISGSFVSFVSRGEYAQIMAVPPLAVGSDVGGRPVNFQAFEIILDVQKAGGVIGRYNHGKETVLKIKGTIDDILSQKVKQNVESISSILANKWCVDEVHGSCEGWILATRLDDTGALMSWRRGCNPIIDAWVPERHDLQGGSYLYEKRIDGEAWRTRKARFTITTVREENIMTAYSTATGAIIDRWECPPIEPSEPETEPDVSQEAPETVRVEESQKSLFRVKGGTNRWKQHTF